RTARERLARCAAMEVFETTLTADRETPAALAVTLSGLRNRQGGLDGLIAIARDITAQREVENQLQQSEKLTALGQLAGGIAHDFNNLLQAILGYAQLTEVMTNLVLNAMDAMPDGGTLSIATKDAADAVVVVVTDTGIGMPEHVRRRVFEPFFSTKGESGSGLGLSMAYSIIRRHGGDI